MEIEKLLEKAKQNYGGSGNALERALGEPNGLVSRWNTGKREPTPEQLAKLAFAAGENPLETLAGLGGVWAQLKEFAQKENWRKLSVLNCVGTWLKSQLTSEQGKINADWVR